MKKAPEEIDPQKYPELACLQAIIHDEDRTPEGKLDHRVLLSVETPAGVVLVFSS